MSGERRRQTTHYLRFWRHLLLSELQREKDHGAVPRRGIQEGYGSRQNGNISRPNRGEQKAEGQCATPVPV